MDIVAVLWKHSRPMCNELRGFGCAGEKGERHLLQRISSIGEWELQVIYAPMGPTDDLTLAEKQQALKLPSSGTIAQAAN
jgi:hypothetical protein